ncbi:unnamed protein product [Toxocara canis]|uniref:Rhomboid domain-containing protein n=1 Tax=Toxocara canis TaxID=6265 RepID=A0A183VF81_TOXCA|nr:unnamed protein product [Toxocara canis]
MFNVCIRLDQVGGGRPYSRPLFVLISSDSGGAMSRRQRLCIAEQSGSTIDDAESFVDDVNDIARMRNEHIAQALASVRHTSLGHFWAVVTLMSKCLGEIFASSSIGYSILSFLFAKTILFTFFIYVALPAFAVTLNMKTPHNELTAADRRLLIFILAFIVGAGTHHLLLNWEQPEFAPPPFYSPVIVALLFEFVCPRFTGDRRLFLLSSIGVAGTICFAYGVQNGLFDFTYFYTSVFAIAMSFYNLQLLIADPKEGNHFTIIYLAHLH